MDNRAPRERGGVVLSHPGLPVPTRRRLLLLTAPAGGFFLPAALLVARWAADGDGHRWFVPGWTGAFVLAWLLLVLTRVRRPAVRRFSQRKDVHAARRQALRTGRLPGSPSVRIGAAARSCDQLEWVLLLSVVGVATGLGALLWPSLPWAVAATGWAVLSAPALVGGVRGWAYLHLYEAARRGPST